jgi:hypothetical protein
MAATADGGGRRDAREGGEIIWPWRLRWASPPPGRAREEAAPSLYSAKGVLEVPGGAPRASCFDLSA